MDECFIFSRILCFILKLIWFILNEHSWGHWMIFNLHCTSLCYWSLFLAWLKGVKYFMYHMKCSLKKVVNFVWVVGTLWSSGNTPGPTVTKNKFLYTPQLKTFEAENLDEVKLAWKYLSEKSSEIALEIQFTWS